MANEQLIVNIERFAAAQGVSTTRACIEAGCGKSFISNIKRGQVPSVAKVAQLAAYLGVSTSDLVGDKRPGADEEEARLFELFDVLNDEGKERLIDYAEDLTASGRYGKKDRPAELGAEEA